MKSFIFLAVSSVLSLTAFADPRSNYSDVTKAIETQISNGYVGRTSPYPNQGDVCTVSVKYDTSNEVTTVSVSGPVDIRGTQTSGTLSVFVRNAMPNGDGLTLSQSLTAGKPDDILVMVQTREKVGSKSDDRRIDISKSTTGGAQGAPNTLFSSSVSISYTSNTRFNQSDKTGTAEIDCYDVSKTKQN